MLAFSLTPRLALTAVAGVAILATTVLGVARELDATTKDASVAASSPSTCSTARSGSEGLIARVAVPSTDTTGVLVPLESGVEYYVVVTGTFRYNAQGGVSDGFNLLVDEARVSSQPSGDHRYCANVIGSERPLNLRVQDSGYSDNGGFLTVSIWKADEGRP